jgi:hypothetical protein
MNDKDKLNGTQKFNPYLTENTVRIHYKNKPLIFFREIIAILVLSFMKNKFIVLKIQPFFFNIKAALNFRNLLLQINEGDGVEKLVQEVL